MMDAPARWMPVIISSTMRFSSIQPLRAAAFTIGIFPAHVVGGHRHIEALAHALNHVQIGQRRLHHDDVRAFFEIERHFAQRLARIRRIHLVAAPVAKLRRGLRGFAERPVERGAIFRGVGKNRDILEIVLVEPAPDGAPRARPSCPKARRYPLRRARARAPHPPAARVSGSFSTSPSFITPQWPWLVYSHRQTSVITSRSSFALRIASIERCTAPCAAAASVPVSSLCSGKPNKNHGGNSEPATSRHSSTI